MGACLIYGSPTNDANETGSGSLKRDIGGMEEVMMNLSANPVDVFNASTDGLENSDRAGDRRSKREEEL